jgi:hypothetical protein
MIRDDLLILRKARACNFVEGELFRAAQKLSKNFLSAVVVPQNPFREHTHVVLDTKQL